MVSLSYKVVVSRPIDFPVTSFTLIVRVRSNESGNPPIQGATVILENQNISLSQKTDKNGEASFANLAQGTYLLTVKKEGFQKHEQSVTVPHLLEVLVMLKKLIELVIEVKDRDTLQPIQGAKVRVTGGQIDKEVYTDQNGIAKVQVVEGQYTVTVSKEGYEDSQAQVTVPLPQGQDKIVIMLKKRSTPSQPPPPPQPDNKTLLLAGAVVAAALITAFMLISSDATDEEEKGEE